MKFLYPQFLWALGALAIPLLIHLFNFRRYTTVYFSDTRLLQNVVKQSKSINRLRQFLIMLARMLVLALLVLAFANPYIPAADTVGDPGDYAVIYIDNSPSMLSGEQQSSSLGTARNKAVEVIKGLPQNYKVQILTNDFQGRQQRFYSKAEAIELVDAITASYAFRNAEAIVERMEQLREDEDVENLETFFISDFQASVFGNLPPLPESWKVNLLPVRSENIDQNFAIDSVWFEKPVLQPGFDQELKVQLSNSGGEEARDISINLNIENALQGAKSIEVPAGGKATATFSIRSEKADHYRGEVSIDAGAPYFDNKFFFTYRVAEPFSILLTGNEEHRERFQRLFSDSIYQLQYSDLTALDYSAIGSHDLIILDAPDNVASGLIQSLRQNLEAGKNVILIPSKEDPESINSVLLNLTISALGQKKGAAKALEVQWDDPHFRDVFTSTPERPSLPNAEEHYDFSANYGYPLITLENGVPLVSRIPVEGGDVILFTANLEHTNLLRHPIFVPLMLNSALFSRQNAPLYTLSGKSSGPVFPGGENSDRPLQIEINEENPIIPRQRNRGDVTELYDLSPDLEPGTYTVTRGENEVGFVAINPQPQESEWEFLAGDALTEKFGITDENVLMADVAELSYSVQKRYEGTPLWKWFVAGALLFLLIEIILIKLWK